MSDISASLSGSGVSQQLQQSQQASASANPLSESGQDGAFSDVFQDVITQADGQPTDNVGALNDMAPAMVVQPVTPLMLNETNLQSTDMAMTDLGEALANYFPYGLTDGNTLPTDDASVAWSGYIAYGDQNGAVAQSYMGDDEQAIRSAPTFDRNMGSSIQRSQQQLRDFMAMQSDGITTQSQPGIANQAGEFIEQLSSITRDRPAGDAGLAQGTQQILNGSMLSPTSALNMSDISTGTTSITRSAEGMQLTPQHPNWGQELGDRVQWMIGKQMQSAEIRLNPPELGALEVKIRVQGDQATVSFTSPHGVVRDAIDAAMPRLRDMLAESGINLADVHVSSQSHGQQQQHSAQSQGSSRTGLNDDNLQPSEVSLTTKLPLTAGQGMLDVYA